MAPVILAMKAEKWASVRVLATAQHRQMLDQVMNLFGIVPNIDHIIMRSNQALTAFNGRLLPEFVCVLWAEMPDVILAQGDATMPITVALACFYHGIPFGHVVAGLRTWDMQNHFREVANVRDMVHDNLGNCRNVTLCDSLDYAPFTAAMKKAHFVISDSGGVQEEALALSTPVVVLPDEPKRPEAVVMVACRFVWKLHRGPICDGHRCGTTATSDSTTQVHSVHVQRIARDTLCHQGLSPRHLDSTSVFQLSQPTNRTQAKSFGWAPCSLDPAARQSQKHPLKPQRHGRSHIKRRRAVDEMGVVKLVRTDHVRIIKEAQSLVGDRVACQSMARGVSPYGDGLAGSRIVTELKQPFATIQE